MPANTGVFLGARALIDLAIPTGIDAAEVLRFQMENGMTGEEAIRLAAAGIGLGNEGLFNRYNGMLYVTSSMYARYRQGTGSTSMTPEGSEFGINDPVRTSQIGHMLPIKYYQDTLSWTRRYLRKADRDQVRADVESIVERFRNRVSYLIWSRVFSNAENTIGSAGYDVGWAIGTGTNVNYIPPQYEGFAFDSTHTHFIYKNSASATFADLFNDMMEELRHHGHTGTVAIYVSMSDLAAIGALTGFAAIESQNIILVSGNSNSPVRVARGTVEGLPGEVVGYYNNIFGQAEIRYHERIPAGYAFATRPYGTNNPRNGLAIRVEPDAGFGLRVTPQLDRSPERQLDYVLFETDFGVGVNDRTNGVVGYIANGAASYIAPTIS